ncbi:rare lipoprotein A [Cupriavidus basilensis OR16]|uniref:Endolytic peptidoglycan transglycosylase RlpA n=1 Tax=Cupriavidus basilensis OR16 TaxID=1127483 RepID=H1S1S1_9BURK|nr:septal ring lytic transglycosylase RlpA family protein [Cupriavidus basilensis]EHP43646.1 rare lipoprotein A [Cupriavidus basilensis OR16]
MPWFPPHFSRPGRIVRLCLHASCALALAACAIPPADESQEGAPTAATPGSAKAAKPGKTAKGDKNSGKNGKAADVAKGEAADHAQKDNSNSNGWGLFRWGGGNDALGEGAGQGSLEGLRPDLGSFEQRGMASWYGKGFHGRKTANGERFDMRAMTAAHPSLPLDSWVMVRNLRNGKVAVVRINDRGPYHGNRVLDVSYGAAKRLGFTEHGSTQVEIRRLSRSEVAALGPQLAPGDDDAGDGGDDASSGTEMADNPAKPARTARKARKPAATKRKSR